MDWILLVAMVALLGFMFWSSRKRAAKMKAEQEAKARAMLPGVKVLLQGGLYGVLVSYDGEDLSKSAIVELAPGMEVEVHSQAILRVVEDETVTEDEFIEAEADRAEYEADVAGGVISSVSDDRAAQKTADTTADPAKPSDAKPQA
ncbi:preprotein translocase subunit YajC [Microbacterium hominis]|uniref:Preprotein translocase subunit YajC n=2 Tax=Microbacterium hominis TaxID=162426 RepID=A0A0B4CZ70_9MICO|nr:preprotein translocase subunit YajC [Microbacterium hominis]